MYNDALIQLVDGLYSSHRSTKVRSRKGRHRNCASQLRADDSVRVLARANYCVDYRTENCSGVLLRRIFLAHTLPDDHSTSDVYKKTRQGMSQSLLCITLLQFWGIVGKGSSELRINFC